MTIAAKCDRLEKLEPFFVTAGQRTRYKEIISALRSLEDLIEAGITVGPVVEGNVDVAIDTSEFNKRLSMISGEFAKLIAEITPEHRDVLLPCISNIFGWSEEREG